MRIRDNKGFTLIELLIVVAIIGIIAAIAIPGLLRARMSGNEASAIGSLRSINSAQVSYSASCGQGGYAVDLATLAMPCGAGATQGYISPDLDPAVAGSDPVIKSGYNVTLAGNGTPGPTDNNGTVTNMDYLATAVPVTLHTTGERGFLTTAAGTIFFNPDGTAAAGTGAPIQ